VAWLRTRDRAAPTLPVTRPARPGACPEGGDEVRKELEPPYDVYLWNDPVTLMDMVVRVLMKVFGYAKQNAELLMMTAHRQGKVVVWTGDREQATSYCIQLGNHGLQATVGKSR
jgi:ATP-dependent Clp protease adaptor protein ClpS